MKICPTCGQGIAATSPPADRIEADWKQAQVAAMIESYLARLQETLDVWHGAGAIVQGATVEELADEATLQLVRPSS